jgi:hypothetical protein
LKLGRSLVLAACAAIVLSSNSHARGVSPYLPLKLAPDIERQVERVLVLAGKPVMRRPISAAVVLDALPRACELDRTACEQVRRYLRRYMSQYAVTSLDVEGALATDDSESVIPNAHGERVDSFWRASASGYFQWGDYVLVNAGVLGYDGEAIPTGSFLSVGFDFAQLDIGFRDHWLSPLRDSSTLISAEAPTMPSITLSNYEPISPLGLTYEVFAAEMSEQDGIRFQGGTTSGSPRLAGLQVGIEPTLGYALTANRITQYGGGARGGRGLSDFFDALTTNQNVQDASGVETQATNRLAALASSILFPGPVPFAFSIEYAGEDNAFKEGYRLGATSLSLGLDLPRLGKSFDATIEISEWQNDWYTHFLYAQEGLTHEDRVLGHWFGDQRVFGNAIGGDSQSLSVGWRRRPDQHLRATYRTLSLDPRWVRSGIVPDYERYHYLGVALDTQWREFPLELELAGGRDVFGDSFARLSASIDFIARERATGGDWGDAEARSGAEWFVDVGANRSKTFKLLEIGVQPDPASRTTGAHIGFGARRPVSERGDIGFRIELDDVDETRLLSLRAIDYRYRLGRRLAVSGFLGVARYDYGLATNGYYWGAGVQLRDVLPKWDIGLDLRHYETLNRDKALPTDPVPSPETHPRLYIDVDGTSFYVTRRW